MFNTRIRDATHVLGQDQGYKPLHIRKRKVIDPTSKAETFLQESSWTPTPKELEAIIRGAPIYVGLLSNSHPPIKVTVGPLPDEGLET